jgi:S-formylglutathione hydrolase FrmB
VIDSISIVGTAFQVVIVVLGVGAVLLSFRWKDGVWKRQLFLGLPITLALVGLAALLVDGLALIPYQFPNSYYLWIGLVLLALVVCLIGWMRFRLWRRVVSALSIVLALLMAVTLINAHYQYYPTLGSLVGVDAQNQVTQQQLDKVRDANNGSLPQHGFTVEVPIPGQVSGFKARDAFVWVPPAWVANPKLKLPVIEMLAGVPGSPSDWTRAGFADRTARAFADAHNGLAPIIVMPDANGSGSADTECVNSPRGQAETYLTVDVPNFVRTSFGASTAPGSFAIAGLSAGGLCAIMLSLRHPALYPTFGDYSGLTSPTVGEIVQPDDTTRALFAGSKAAYAAHDPLALLGAGHYPKLAGWFEVGTADSAPLAAQRTLIPLARKAQITTCAVEIPGGGHDFDVWTKSFLDSLPWLSYRLGLTPAPADLSTTCG